MNVKSLTTILKLLLLSLPLFAQNFIQTDGTRFTKNGQTYHYLGVNYWYGMNLGSQEAPGNRKRLLRELDQLQSLGLTNLRIIAATEGPDSEPWRIVPALQTEAGIYNEALLEGLDFLLAELSKRNMHAVLCLNNMWPWSGGFGQYLNWTTGKTIPYPPPAKGGKWLRYMRFATGFFGNAAAQKLYQDHIAFIITRVNSITGVPYTEDPTIMAWQLANEPRSLFGRRQYLRWIENTAAYIRRLDPHHLISVGSEGNAIIPWSAKFRQEHQIKNIDYCTAHIWVQNWGWYDPEKATTSYPKALKRAQKYLSKHLRISRQLKKPFVLEEFGMARDGGSYDANATTSYRDQYYKALFTQLLNSAQKVRATASANIWSWAGEGRPRTPKTIWQPGDDFTGDPPFEYQGWYSVYDQDQTTLQVLKKFAKKFSELR